MPLQDEYHNVPEPNNNRYSEFDAILESTKQRFKNFDYIDEYHNDYDPYPMAGHSNSSAEEEGRKDLQKELNGSQSTADSSSATASGSSSAAISSSGTVASSSAATSGATASASAAAASGGTVASVSASTVLASSFVAIVAVAAVVVPAVANSDIQIYMEAEFTEGNFTYLILLDDAVEDEVYYACVYENGSLSYKEQIIDNRQSNTISGLNGYRDHTLEVRAGEMSLLVLGSVTIPGMPVWAELLTAESDYDSIYFSVYLHGEDETAYVAMYDKVTGETVYESALSTGRLAETVTGLEDSHTYTIKIRSETEAYLSVDVSTLSPSVDFDHITASTDSIDYGLTVSGIQKPTTLDLYDPATSASVYSVSVVNGYNEGVISGLSSNHTYVLTVSSETAVYYSGEITTVASAIELDSLSAVSNTIEYAVTVSGAISDAKLDLTDPETSTSVYSVDLTEGVNTAAITDLLFNHTYVLSASAGTEVYFSQEITTEATPVTVELESLTAEENTVSYSVLVTGNGAIATASLYYSDGVAVYSVDLSEGSNTATVTDLEFDHEYTFVVSSGEEVFVSESVTTEEEIIPTTVTVDYIKAFGDTYQYRILVEGNTDNPIITVTNGEEFVYATAALSVGVNEGSLEGEDLGYHLECLVSVEGSETYYSEWLWTQEIYDYELTQDNKTIQYTVSIFNDWEDCEIFVIDDEDYTGEPAQLDDAFKFPAEDVVTSGTLDYEWILYGHSYTFGVLLNGGDVSAYGHVTVNYAEIEVTSSTGDGITCQVTISIDDYQNATIALLDEGLEEPIQTMDATGLSGSYTFTEGVFGLHTYFVGVYYMDDLAEYVETTTTGEVTEVTVNVAPYADGNVIHYDFTVTGNSDDPWIFVSLDDDTVYSASLLTSSSGDTSSVQLEYNQTYLIEVLGDESDDPYYSVYVNIGPYATIEMFSTEDSVVCDVTVIEDVEDITLVLYSDEEMTDIAAGPVNIASAYTRVDPILLDTTKSYYPAILKGGDKMGITYEQVSFELTSSAAMNTVSISASTDLSDLTDIKIGLYADSSCTDPVNVQPFSSSPAEMEFGDLEWGTEYYAAIMLDSDIVLKRSVTTSTVSLDLLAYINGINVTVTNDFTEYTGVTVGIYTDEDCQDPVADTVISLSGASFNYFYSNLELDTTYYVGVLRTDSSTQTSEIVICESVKTDAFSITAAGVNNTIQATLTTDCTDFNSYEITMGLYTNEACTTAVDGTVQQVTASSGKSGNYSDLDWGIPYYVGVLRVDPATQARVIVIYDTVSTQAEVTLEYFNLSNTNELEFGVSLNGGYTEGTLSIMIGSTIKDSVDLQEPGGDTMEGTFDSWDWGESYTLNVSIMTGSGLKQYEIGSIDIPDPGYVLDYEFTGSEDSISYSVTLDDDVPELYLYVLEHGDGPRWDVVKEEQIFAGENAGTFTDLDPQSYLVVVNDNQELHSPTLHDYAHQTVNVSINDSWDVPGSASKVYGEDVVTSGSLTSGLEPTFSYYSDADRTNELTTEQLNALSAGTTVYVKVTTSGDGTYNPFNDSTISFVIQMADDTVVVTMSGYAYGQSATPSAPSVTKGTTGAATLYYSTVGTYTADNVASNATAWPATLTSTSVDVGTYYVYAVTTADTNYNAGFAVSGSTFTVSKGNDAWVQAGSASKAYGQDVVTSGTLKSGLEPTFSYYTDEDRTSLIADINSVNADTTVYVKVTTEGNENYNAFEDSTIEFTVQGVVTYNSIDLNTKSNGTIQLNSSIYINASNTSDFTCEIYDSADGYVGTVQRVDFIFNVIIQNINYGSTYKVYIKESDVIVSSKNIIIPADTSDNPYWQDMS